MHGLYLLWWVREKQLSPAPVASMMALGDLAVMALEVPTGWVADRLGHRVSLIAGSAVQVAGMLACWLCPGVYSLIAGCLVVALGDALRSGADQALMYRSCVADGREPDFQTIEGRAHAVSVIALVCLVLLGGLIVEFAGFDAAWALETMLCAVGIWLAWSMAEPSAAAQDPDSDLESPRGCFSRQMLALIVPASLISAAAGAAAFAVQVQDSITVTEATTLVAIITAAEAVGAVLGGRVRAMARSRQWLCALGGVTVTVTIAWMGADRSGLTAMFAVAVILALGDGLAQPWRAAGIQRLAADDARASAASLASACDMACSSVLLPIMGMIGRRRARR